MRYKINWIYQNTDGEYFLSKKHNGKLVLSNPSYPFVFLFEVLEPLKEIGNAKKFGHLIKKEELEFHKGECITVKIENGKITSTIHNDI